MSGKYPDIHICLDYIKVYFMDVVNIPREVQFFVTFNFTSLNLHDALFMIVFPSNYL